MLFENKKRNIVVYLTSLVFVLLSLMYTLANLDYPGGSKFGVAAVICAIICFVSIWIFRFKTKSSFYVLVISFIFMVLDVIVNILQLFQNF